MSKSTILSKIFVIWTIIGPIFIETLWIYCGVSLETLYSMLPWYKTTLIVFIGGPLLWASLTIIYGIEFIYNVVLSINILEYLTTK